MSLSLTRRFLGLRLRRCSHESRYIRCPKNLGNLNPARHNRASALNRTHHSGLAIANSLRVGRLSGEP